MFGDVVERLLADAEQQCFQPARQTLADTIGNADWVPCRLEMARLFSQCGRHTKVVKARRPKSCDDPAKVGNRLARHSDQIVNIVGGTRVVREKVEVDEFETAMKSRHLLCHAVMEIGANGCTFIFLGAHDPRQNLLQLLLAPFQPRQQAGFRTPLNVHDQPGLNQLHQQSQGVSVFLRGNRRGVHWLGEDDAHARLAAFREGGEWNHEIRVIGGALTPLDRTGGIACEQGSPLGCIPDGLRKAITICARQFPTDIDQ